MVDGYRRCTGCKRAAPPAPEVAGPPRGCDDPRPPLLARPVVHYDADLDVPIAGTRNLKVPLSGAERRRRKIVDTVELTRALTDLLQRYGSADASSLNRALRYRGQPATMPVTVRLLRALEREGTVRSVHLSTRDARNAGSDTLWELVIPGARA